MLGHRNKTTQFLPSSYNNIPIRQSFNNQCPAVIHRKTQSNVRQSALPSHRSQDYWRNISSHFLNCLNCWENPGYSSFCSSSWMRRHEPIWQVENIWCFLGFQENHNWCWPCVLWKMKITKKHKWMIICAVACFIFGSQFRWYSLKFYEIDGLLNNKIKNSNKQCQC